MPTQFGYFSSLLWANIDHSFVKRFLNWKQQKLLHAAWLHFPLETTFSGSTTVLLRLVSSTWGFNYRPARRGEGQRVDVTQRNSLESFRSRWVWPSPWLWAVCGDQLLSWPPFLGRSLRGSRTSPTRAFHPWPGSRRGAAVRMTSGAKVGGPQRFQTGSQRPELTRASGRRRGPRASGQTPAGRRRSPRAASPASPRKPRSRPTLPAFPGPTQRWRSRKLAPRLPQAGSGRGPACGRVGRVAASAFLLPAWRWVVSWGPGPSSPATWGGGGWGPLPRSCPGAQRRWLRRQRPRGWRGRPLIPGDRRLFEPRRARARRGGGSGKRGARGGPPGRARKGERGENTRKGKCGWLWRALSFRRRAGLIRISCPVDPFRKEEE